MADPSFDVVSKVDHQEVDNALNQTAKEAATRYDFTVTGAAIACPERKTVCLQSDGGGMYTLQSLWTQARENLDVVNVIFANHSYRILMGELTAVGATPGKSARQLFDLGPPDLDWIKLAGGMGMEAVRADTLDKFADVFKSACARKGPFLIELAVP